MRASLAIVLAVALSAFAAVAAQEPQPEPDSPGTAVAVQLDVMARVALMPGDEFNITGNVTYENPSAEELSIDLKVEAGSWEAAVSPERRTVSDGSGRFQIVVRVVVPRNGTSSEQVVVSGQWATEGDEGEVVPDTYRGLRLDLGGSRDAGPGAMVAIALIGTAAAGAAAVGYGLWSAARKAPPVVPPLYTRLKRHEIVGHEARQVILERLALSPGTSLRGLVESVGESRSTVMYHLRVLEKDGLVRSARDGRNRLFYPQGASVRAVPDLGEAIAESVMRSPGIDISRVARELKTSKQLVSYHVQRMERSGRIWVEREGRRKALYPRGT